MKNHSSPDQIEAPESDYLYINPSQLPDSGNGLFTAIDIYKGEIIAVFNGEKLTQKQAAQRVAAHDDRYFMNLHNGKIFDTENVAGFAKYANDAKGSLKTIFSNNAKIAMNENQIVLIAKQKIPAGSEIFCGYGTKYWKKHRSD